MSIRNALAGIAVTKLENAIQWYERLLAITPKQPMSEVAEWKLPGGGCIQVFADATRAGKSSMTLSVDDLNEEITRLKTLGIEVGGIQGSEQVKIAFVKDPDGNQIILAQPLTSEIAQ